MATFLSKLGNIVNNSQNKVPANEFVVVTKQDGLIHKYFFECDTYWDSNNCLARISLGFAKDNHQRVNYWTGYEDVIYVYMGNDIIKDIKNNIVNYKVGKKKTPFFVGRVYNVYEQSNQMMVQVNNIGERFKQEIPEQFRTSYINNQNVRDTFQAICEFLGVYYICPPANITQTGSSKPDAKINDPDSKKIEEKTTKKDIKNKSDSKDKNSDENNNENSGTDNNNSNTKTINNGYSQINFDGNGAITFNGAVIEESANSEETLLQITDTTYDDFLKEGQDVIKDVKKFLNGEIFDETHPFYLDYNAITVQPKSTSSSTPKTTEDPNPDTAKSMKKTKKSAEDLKTITDTKTAIQSRQLTNPVSNTMATNVKSPVNIQKSLK